MSKSNSFLGFIAGVFLTLKTKRKTRASTEDLNHMEFKTSTQELGLRFTEHIRNIFRFRWIKRHRW